jgi:hypothetical protein
MQWALGRPKIARRWVQNHPSYINNLGQVLPDMSSDTPAVVCEATQKRGPHMTRAATLEDHHALPLPSRHARAMVRGLWSVMAPPLGGGGGGGL